MTDVVDNQPQKKRPRRFIAGVVCPKCSEMDRTVMYDNDAGEEVRECISCGFNQTSSEQAVEDQQRQQESDQLATRVTPLGKAVLDSDEKPLKIIGLDSTK